MHGQAAPVFCRYGGHGVYLGQAAARGVVQPQGNARRARAQRPVGNADHRVRLGGAGPGIHILDAHGPAHGKAVAHQLRLVDHIACARLSGEPALQVQRGKPAVAADSGGNALHGGELPRIGMAVQMAVHIDKARGHNKARRVHHAFCRKLMRGDIHDLAVFHGDVCDMGRTCPHVYHAPAREYHVNHRTPPCPPKQGGGRARAAANSAAR